MKATSWIQDVAYSGNGEEKGEGLGVGIRNRTTRNRDCDGEVVSNVMTLAFIG